MAVRKTKVVLRLKDGSKKTGRTLGQARRGRRKGEKTYHIVAPVRGYRQKPPNSFRTYKVGKITHSPENDGQPAGKPRRVKAVRRKRNEGNDSSLDQGGFDSCRSRFRVCPLSVCQKSMDGGSRESGGLRR